MRERVYEATELDEETLWWFITKYGNPVYLYKGRGRYEDFMIISTYLMGTREQQTAFYESM